MSEPKPVAKPSLRRRFAVAVRRRFTPEGTRAASLVERVALGRLSARAVARLNAALEMIGELATWLLIGIFAAALFGLDWRGKIESSFNQGEPIQHAVTIGILLSVLSLVALRSVIGAFRWRIQRELWRRDAAALATEREKHDQ